MNDLAPISRSSKIPFYRGRRHVISGILDVIYEKREASNKKKPCRGDLRLAPDGSPG
jgi:hypothetical protein